MKKQVKFGDLKIQKLNRIALPSSLLENLELNVGDEVGVFLDIEKDEIIVNCLKDKKRVKFGDLKIQKLNRIALPSSLLENLELNVGDEVEVFLDIEKDEIVIRRNKK